MIRLRSHLRVTPALAVALIGAGCDGVTGVDELATALEITPAAAELALHRDTSFTLRNAGSRPLGPLAVGVTVVTNSAEQPTGEANIQLNPATIATLNPGDSRTVTVAIGATAGLTADHYVAEIGVALQDTIVRRVTVGFDVIDPLAADVASLAITPLGRSEAPQGEVIHLNAVPRDADGATVIDAPIVWAVRPPGGGLVTADGAFVGYGTGAVSIVARSGLGADTVALTLASRDVSLAVSVVANGRVTDRVTSDLWVHGTAAYTGTWGARQSSSGVRFGNTLHAWDVGNPNAPVRGGAVTVDARVVNDVKIRADGTLGVMTHEGSADNLNGITLLDLTDPLDPQPITRFTTSLETGVHNAWIEGDYLYLVVDGSSAASGLRILDVSDPALPQVVASFYAGSSFLHDVYVRDGLAFLSHWDAGLVILDVGNGMAGGTPTAPVEVSRLRTAGGQTHNAWYWPDGGYVFVGEEDFATPGIMHVVDVNDLWNPREVATFTAEGQTPHNFWMDEARATLYLAWYENGLRALDVSGALLGALDRQGRQRADVRYAEANGDSFGSRNWAPQLHNGLVYLSDMNTGLWIVRPEN